MDLGLAGKVALVTASSRGLGRAIAEQLAREGCRVVVSARGEADLHAARDAIATATGAQVLAVPADMSDLGRLAALVDAAIAQWGRIDVLVTNGGGPPAGRFEDHDAGAWEAAFRSTLRGVVELCRAVVPGMRARKWGRILNVTSITVKQPVAGLMLSTSIRAAVTGFARTLADEVAADGITVNNLLPGYTRTDRLVELADALAEKQGVAADAIVSRWVQEIPAGRLGEPAELAALAAFLASERAAYVTGASIAVDGGWIRSLL
jgi:3-oxoacyl-[acyl-carrier protein] reductase